LECGFAQFGHKLGGRKKETPEKDGNGEKKRFSNTGKSRSVSNSTKRRKKQLKTGRGEV